jgi:hypothetical protein
MRFYRDAKGEFITRAIVPHTGSLIADQGSKDRYQVLSAFISSCIGLAGPGLLWIVGATGMTMLVLLVSGW